MGYEKWASVRLLLTFLSLDIVSLMVVKFPGNFMGNGRVLLSGGVASSKDFGVTLWNGRSPIFFVVVDLFCFVLSTSGVPPNEGFQCRARGSCDWTTRNLFRNWGLGTCQAHYDI